MALGIINPQGLCAAESSAGRFDLLQHLVKSLNKRSR